MTNFTFMNDLIYQNWTSFVLVDSQTLNSFCQVEKIQVIESHEMSIPSENKHFFTELTHWLPISCTRLLPNNKSVRLIINNLLPDLILIVFLNTWVIKILPIVSRVFSIDSVVGDKDLFDLVMGWSSNCLSNYFFLSLNFFWRF